MPSILEIPVLDEILNCPLNGPPKKPNKDQNDDCETDPDP
tara:strand:- start:1968 stop:2087 length:120 start_codon:yes stop_codon:yes gene_type:complete